MDTNIISDVSTPPPSTQTVTASGRRQARKDTRQRGRWARILLLGVITSLLATWIEGVIGSDDNPPPGQQNEGITINGDGAVIQDSGNTALVPRVAADGQDPQEAGCVPDAGTIAAQTLPGLGHLRLIYSNKCDAFWAKIERTDGAAIDNKLEVAVIQRDKPSRTQSAVEPDTTSAYTFLLVGIDPTSRICATGAVWVDGVRRPFPEPVC